MQNMSAFLGINAIRLEKVEERLKADVLKEAKSMGGLLLVHQELCKLIYAIYYACAERSDVSHGQLTALSFLATLLLTPCKPQEKVK